jgi:hypothetical protein
MLTDEWGRTKSVVLTMLTGLIAGLGRKVETMKLGNIKICDGRAVGLVAEGNSSQTFFGLIRTQRASRR